MSTPTPRIRSLLRQANKVAEVGKKAAAAKLFQEILDEAPDTVEAWLGLAENTTDPAGQQAAYEQALALAPDNVVALTALGRPVPAELLAAAAKAEAAAAAAAEADAAAQIQEAAVEEEELLYVCYRHPDRKTNLKCYNCSRPICIKCANRTPVGYLCPDCKRDMEEAFFTANIVDYIAAGLVAFILGLIGGYLTQFLGFFVIFLAAGGGTLIGRISFRAARRHRGRWLPHTVMLMVILGGVLPMLPLLLGLFVGSFPIGSLIWAGVYLFLTPSAAFWQVK